MYGLDSVVALSNVNSQMVERYSYDVFGKPAIRDADGSTRSTSAFGNRFMFTGREYDSEVGLYYYRARFYKPNIGRFLQTDPIRYAAGLNLYTYCGNNPIKFIDPMGLDVWVGKSGLGGWHHSINVGDPGGSYRSWSYALKGDNYGQRLNNFWNPFSNDFRTGEVYKDYSGSDGIYKDKYLKTTPEFDKIVGEGLDSVAGTEAGYDFWGNNCWGFSDEVFDALKDLLEDIKKGSET